jgi:hypothetical protein
MTEGTEQMSEVRVERDLVTGPARGTQSRN